MSKSRGIRKRFPKEIDDQILALHALGIPYQSIEDQLGIPHHKVCKVLRKHAAKLTPEQRSANAKVGRAKTAIQWPEGTTDKILHLHRLGVSRRDISAQLEIDINKVISDIQRHATYKLTKEQVSNTHKKYSRETEAAIIHGRQSGLAIDEIALQHGIGQSTVRYICAKSDITLTSEQRYENSPNKKYHSNKVDLVPQIQQMRADKASLDQISDHLGVSRQYLKGIIQEFGLHLTEEQKKSRAPVDQLAGARLIELRQEGANTESIATDLGLSRQQVIGYLARNKIRLADEHRSGVYRRGSKYTWGQVREACSLNGLSIDSSLDDNAHVTGVYIPVTCHCGTKCEIRLYDILSQASTSCGCTKSAPQKDLAKEIEALGFDVEHNTRSIIAPREIDIYIPALKLGIEYCGLYWHGERFGSEGARTQHLAKLKLAEEKGIRLVTIFADEWLNGRDRVMGYLKAKLQKIDHRIWARKTTVSKVSMGTVRQFLKDNHIQGAAGGLAFALRSGDDIVAASTFKRRGQDWELVRYCVKAGYNIVGGFQKLFSEFIKTVNPQKVVTFSDRRWSTGDMYARNGFVQEAVLPPSYWYTLSGSDTFRVHKSLFRKEKINKKFGPQDPTKTEWEIMKGYGYDRVWDCGLVRWAWNRS